MRKYSSSRNLKIIVNEQARKFPKINKITGCKKTVQVEIFNRYNAKLPKMFNLQVAFFKDLIRMFHCDY